MSSEHLSISIGNIPLRFHIPEDALRQKAHKRYAEFVREDPGALPIFVNTVPAEHGRNVSGECDNDLFAFTWERSALFLARCNAQFHDVRHEYGLDSLTRILLSVLLAPECGFLLHAATVLRNQRAYVFTGKSGAGKSTVAGLSPAGSVLTDEISLLKFVDGEWHAFGTPFWGEFRAAGANVHAPIAGIYFLNQALTDRVEAISARTAVRALLPNTLFFSRDARMTGSLLRVLTDFVQSVPCNRLFFRKDYQFWSVLA